MGPGQQITDRVAYLKTIDTPTLANAIEELDVRPRSEGFAPLSIRCLFPEMGRMCGYAVTAQVETVSRMTPLSKAAFCDLFEAVEASPKPSVVVMQEIGGSPESATHCGEVMATIFTRFGAIGVVSDCGVRDIPEVRAMGMHYFARGAVPSHAYFHIVRTGVPVHIAGFVVKPGEMLHGDENGLISVPECDLGALDKAVEDVRRRERKLMDYVRAADCTIRGLKDRFLE